MRLLRRGPFLLLFAGTGLNAIGSWATIVALWGYATAHFHAGPEQVALLGLAWSLPGGVLSAISGLPIDRFGPKAVLIASDLIGVVTALAMALAGSFGALAALALVSGLVEAFGRPAALALPARLADDEDLLAANALLGAAERSAIVFGPLVAALAIGVWGIRAPFLLDAATFVVGALALVPVRLRPLLTAAGPRTRLDLLGGVRVARRVPALRWTLVLSAIAFSSWAAFFVLEPLYVRDVLHRSPAMLGVFQAAFGVGLVSTTLFLPRIGDRVARVGVVALSVACSGVAAAAYVATRSPVIAAAAVFLWGVDVAFFDAPSHTLVQRASPVEAHGRVLALLGAIDSWSALAVMPLCGLVVAGLGVRATGALVGLLTASCGLAALVATRTRRRAGALDVAAA